MRLFWGIVGWAVATMAQAASIPMLEFPVKTAGSPAGSIYRMADHPNSVWVFESYRLSCVYCNQNAPNVDKLANDYKDNPRVQVLDAGLDTGDAEYIEWNRRHKPNHPVIQDVGYKVFKAFRVENAIPQVFVVDCKGNLVGSAMGAWGPTESAAIRGYINKALETTCL